MKTVSFYKSPLGLILLAADNDALCGIWFSGQKDIPEEIRKLPASLNVPEILSNTRLWLDRYFAGKMPESSGLRLAPEGSEFRRQVWDILLTIPYGETVTYGQIAKQLELQTGRKASAQAVGGAVGHNPISLIIPCHRVIGADGSLTGYAGGLKKKKALLEMEQDNIKLPVR